MTATSEFTPSGGTPLVVPKLEPIDDDFDQASPVPAPRAQRARFTSRKAASVAHTYENPFTTPAPKLSPGSDEPDWPTRHPPNRYSLVLPGAKPSAGTAESSELNFHGHVALGTGLVVLVLVALLWIFEVGVWWLYVPLTGLAIWSGVVGQRAANRSLATNPNQARLGILAGALALVGAVAFAASAILSSAP